MPVVLAYAAVGLAGIALAAWALSAVASHFDGTSASDAYSKAVLQREQSLIQLHKQGMTFEQANAALGKPPEKPKGFSTFTFSGLLIATGAIVIGGAIFGPSILRSLKNRSSSNA